MSAQPPAPRPRPKFLTSAMRIFDLSIGEMLWSRRTIFMALVVGVPVLLALILRTLQILGAPSMRVSRVTMTGPTIFGLMIWVFYLRFSVPVLGIFYGTALIADEVDDKTITYLFTRPIARSAVLFGKYLAYMGSTVFVVLPSVVLVWLLVIPMGSSFGGDNFLNLAKDLVILVVGLAVYGAFFAFIGAAVKRPLLVGLLLVFGLETTLLALPGYLKTFTIAYYLQGLVPHAMPGDSPMSLIQSIFRQSPTLGECLFWMTVMEVGFLWIAGRIVTKKEYVLEQ